MLLVQCAVVVCCAGCSRSSLSLAGDLSLEELMAKYGYVSQGMEEDSTESSDGGSEWSPPVWAVMGVRNSKID